MKKKILIVFGTRPEAIKMAPVIKKFQKNPDLIETVVCSTGQHREMLDQVLEIFKIKPDYNLAVMKEAQDLFDVSSSILMGMKEVLEKEQPDLVMVHGDTTTSSMAALAAYYKRIPVAHVEAGLRTNNKLSPWPEEINRQLTARIADYHFAPTETSRQNLLKENIEDSKIFVTGNTVIDALLSVVKLIEEDKNLQKNLGQILKEKDYDVNSRGEDKKIVLITGHRRENFGDGFKNICEAIKELANAFPNVDFVYPVHLNPNVQKPVNQILNSEETKNRNLFLIKPLDYLSFVYLMNKSYLILTDSGGIQEEAPGLGKPVLVMRDTTERPEAVEAGTVKLVGTDRELIFTTTSSLLSNKEKYNKMANAINPFGNGDASSKILEKLL